MSPRTPRHSTKSKVHHVACAIDDNMVYPLAVLTHSLAEHQSEPFVMTIGYLQGTLSPAHQRDLSALLTDMKIDFSFLPLTMDSRFITQGHISPTTFSKFLIADAISTSHLWLDADTIALKGWDSIFRDIDNPRASTVLVVARRHDQTSRAQNPEELPFNAGVLGWPQGTRREWSEILSTLPAVDTQEQYLFNVLYAEDAHWVSEKFNTLTYTVEQLPEQNPPFIIHYAGAHKPWHLARPYSSRCTQYRCPWSEWFLAEEHFLAELSEHLSPTARRLREDALHSGKVRWRRDHSGYIFLRALRMLGPLAPVAIAILSGLKQWIPRGTHPLHPMRA